MARDGNNSGKKSMHEWRSSRWLRVWPRKKGERKEKERGKEDWSKVVGGRKCTSRGMVVKKWSRQRLD